MMFLVLVGGLDLKFAIVSVKVFECGCVVSTVHVCFLWCVSVFVL